MKVRQHSIDCVEAVAGADEDVGLSTPRYDRTVSVHRARF